MSLFIILPVAIMTAITWERGQWRRLVVGLFAIGMFTVAGVFASIWLGPSVFNYAADVVDPGRYGGTFVNQNEAGIACTIIALFGLVSLGEVKRKWPVILGLVACFVAIILTFSRGAMLTYLIVMGTSYAATSGRFNWRFIAGIVGAGALVSLAAQSDITWATWLSPDQQGRVSNVVSLVTTGDLDAAGGGDRRWLAQLGFQEWMESPLLGNGLGTQRDLRAAGTGSHNQYLLLLGDSGLLPALIYCAVLVATFLAAARSRRGSVRIFLAGFAALILILGFHNHNILENRLCNFGFGIAFGLCGIRWQRPEERSVPARPLSRTRLEKTRRCQGLGAKDDADAPATRNV